MSFLCRGGKIPPLSMFTEWHLCKWRQRWFGSSRTSVRTAVKEQGSVYCSGRKTSGLFSDSKVLCPLLCASFIQSFIHWELPPRWLYPTGKFMEPLLEGSQPRIPNSEVPLWPGENNKQCDVKQIRLSIPAPCLTDCVKDSQFLTSLATPSTWDVEIVCNLGERW